MEHIQVLISVNYSVCPYLVPFLRYSETLVENRLFNLCLTPSLWVTPLEFRRDFLRQKTRVHGLSYGIVSVILGLTKLVSK